MPGRVMVLEDNELSRFVIREVLERAGYSCIEAATPAAAIESMREQASDLLVTDVVLGVESGIAAARKVSRLSPGMPVLYISGHPLEQLLARGQLGQQDLNPACSAFLQKPFVPEALLEAVGRLLEGKASPTDGAAG